MGERYRHHLFVCTGGKTCASQGSAEVFTALRDGVDAAGLKGIVRVNHAGCFSQCGHGPMVVVYPDDVWYHGVDVVGAERIVSEHLVGGAEVAELRYLAPPGDNKVPKAPAPVTAPAAE